MTTWAEGDYPAMARRLLPAAVAAVAGANIRAGDQVLDVATGTGNAALLAALCGARVTGVDFEPALLDLARSQASESSVEVEWLLGEATRLPVADGSADVVLSVFGVMYAGDQAAAATELARVCAPGGRVVLTAWMPGSFMPALGQATAAYLPPPPAGGHAPSRWGDADAVAGLLASAELSLVTAEPRQLRLRFPDAGTAATFLVNTAGHLVAERPRLHAENRWSALLGDIHALVHKHATCAAEELSIRLDYLLVAAEASRQTAS
ncbi:class I SAM-dependent methyltransferase [Micromonospora sp. bgisy143]|uniref:class I SAM-dependent methyltransferase n=1 Tax=Micromonospora sp. bgisy143 TaxID=3413790 RepID=UPI003EBB14B0